jgi:hypothetical protein
MRARAPPASVRDRVDANAAANRERMRGVEETYRALTAWLAEVGLSLSLKVHARGAFGSSAESRAQYDIDLLLPRETAQAALADRARYPPLRH